MKLSPIFCSNCFIVKSFKSFLWPFYENPCASCVLNDLKTSNRPAMGDDISLIKSN